jgi:hypothetical protein
MIYGRSVAAGVHTAQAARVAIFPPHWC